MDGHLQFRVYSRSFRQPLQTRHGQWAERQGIILRLRDGAGRVGFGEIAPIPWFGSETLEQAVDCCRQLSEDLLTTGESWRSAIADIPDRLPACQFGFESALAMLDGDRDCQPEDAGPNSAQGWSALLPAGEAALSAWRSLWDQGFRTFKWKLGGGSEPLATSELAQLQRLRRALPRAAKLRLDANGGLSRESARRYLDQCDALGAEGAGIEFLEQPLPPEDFAVMQDLAQQYQTPLALDESVATLCQLRGYYQWGWRGVFVVKPAIAGSPTRLRQFCRAHPLDLVFSSALETPIGRQAGLRLAADVRPSFGPHDQGQGDSDAPRVSDTPAVRALGYGTAHWFQDAEIEDFEQLWQSLSSN